MNDTGIGKARARTRRQRTLGVVALTMLLALQAVVAGGCKPMIALDTPIVVRATPRELKIRNGMAEPITILTVQDKPGPAKVIAPDAVVVVPFRIEEIGSLKRLDPLPGASDRRIGLVNSVATVAAPAATDGPAYVGLSGVDAVVRASFGGREHRFIFRLQDACIWKTPPPDGFLLEITGPPTAGVPERLCEDD